MLLLAVLCMAAFFCPAFSQPAKAGGLDINDYLVAALGEANEWEGSLESIMRNPSVQPLGGSVSELGVPIGYQLTQEYTSAENDAENKENYETNRGESNIQKEALHKREAVQSMFRPKSLFRRQFVIDPIGGGYLLRRQSGPESVRKASPVKRLFPLDPIGGGYLLKRIPQGNSIATDDKTLQEQAEGGNRPLIGPITIGDDSPLQKYPNAEENSFGRGSNPRKIPLDPSLNYGWGRNEKNEQNSKRSPGRKSDFLLRLVPKEKVMGTLTTDKSFLNNKDVHMFEIRVDSFPIDPIGGGFLLGRSVNYDDENSKSNFA